MKMKTKTYKTWLPCFQGFYNSYHDLLDDEEIEQEVEYYLDCLGVKLWCGNDLDFLYEVDYKTFKEDYSKENTSFIEAFFKEEGLEVSFVFDGLYSPKEYNFVTDSINVECTVNLADVLKIVKSNLVAFAEYIEEQFTPRSGFMPFYSNDSEVWLKKIEEDVLDKTELGVVLSFIAKEVFDFEDEMIFDMNTDFCPLEYISCNLLEDDISALNRKKIEVLMKEKENRIKKERETEVEESIIEILREEVERKQKED